MTLDLGANFASPDRVRFKVWAPLLFALHLQLEGRPPLPMHKDEKGYFHLEIQDLKEGGLYSYILPNGDLRPDPVSRFLPKGLTGPTAILKSDFSWTDGHWKRIPQKDLIFYECHVGTFSSKGTFEGVLEHLPHLKKLGITCLSLMPIAQFSGRCNWGYDGSSIYAPHNGYGSPKDLKKLINACHAAGIAVCLDVVYNHLGPKDSFLNDFGPYRTDSYKTLWGPALNFDGPYSNEVRHFFIQNALYWVDEFHFDVLRLDATQAIFDFSATPFLQQLCAGVKDKAYIVVENDLNKSQIIRHVSEGGYGADGFWNDDFHHALHVAITHEKQTYYKDYQGGLKDLKTILQNSVLYDGTRYSTYRKQTYGSSFHGIEPQKLICFSQTHDQVGNRAYGDRLTLSFEQHKAVALLILLSPYLPLLFMGQEYGETAPFEYFVDFDEKLSKKVFEGRKKEFRNTDEIPHPDYSAFMRSKLQWKINADLLALYQHLIAFRKALPHFERKHIKVEGEESWISIEYAGGFLVFYALSEGTFSLPHAKLLFHTEQTEFGGSNSAHFDGQKLSAKSSIGAVFQLK
jgi:maltooligosyltrehalose trehalohydrolase